MTLLTAREIRADIESRIATGSLRTDERLPAVRTLAEQLGVSPATVSAAYKELRVRGMVIGRGRQGTRVAPTRRSEAATAPSLPDGLIDAMHGSPDPDLLPDLTAGLATAAAQPQPRYGSELIEPELRVAARALFERDGIDATHLTVTSGAMDAVERVIAALDLRIGDRIGVEDPGHFPVHQLARTSGLELAPLPVDEHGITPTGLQAALTTGIRALVVTPRAHNPTGAAFDEQRASELNQVLAKHPDVALVQDDHAGLISGLEFFALAPPGPRWATMRSLGKSFGPDVRVALVAGDSQTMHRVSTGLSHGPGWVSYVLQRLAAYLLKDPDTGRLLDKAASSYSDRREHLMRALADADIASSGVSGLNVWIPTGRPHELVEAARNAGYAIRTADGYRLKSPTAVRVTISGLTNPQIDEIAAALSSRTPPTTHSPSI